MIAENQLRTGAWYGDYPLKLDFPAEWDVTFLSPRTPAPLTDDEIVRALERPIGQPPIRHLCRGKSKPLVIVDDPNRPTPAARVMPFLLRHFSDAGIPASDVRILIATGTHGAADMGTIRKKVGPEAAACKLQVHDATRNLVRLGRTSFGTPVIINQEVPKSDFVIGIGGVYPNHTAGFGGGSKLVLGVLGFRSILNLHYKHESLGWGTLPDRNAFRCDLNEIARMVGLNTAVSLHVNANREAVRMVCGDHFCYYEDEVAFCRKAFGVPMPEHADVVISNAYPNDLSLTFARMKGTAPLRHCSSGASRIVIASCSEGVGAHALFPVGAKFQRQRHLARRLCNMNVRDVARKVERRLSRALRSRKPNGVTVAPKNPIWLYRPGTHSEPLPSQIGDTRITDSWPEILESVRREQAGRIRFKVIVYPCAPLQFMHRPGLPSSPQPVLSYAHE
jgi:nickel-dependent lactate racemase